MVLVYVCVEVGVNVSNGAVGGIGGDDAGDRVDVGTGAGVIAGVGVGVAVGVVGVGVGIGIDFGNGVGVVGNVSVLIDVIVV